jgi:hypothetical protein
VMQAARLSLRTPPADSVPYQVKTSRDVMYGAIVQARTLP